MKKGFRLFRHPVHPALTDFPLALLSVSLLWDVVGLWSHDPAWWRMAFWCMVVGLGVALPAVISGLLDYAAIPDKHPALKMATWHLIVMLAAAVAFTGSLIVRGKPIPDSMPRLWTAVALSVLGFLFLGLGGWMGGELVFGHGIGREERPPDESS